MTGKLLLTFNAGSSTVKIGIFELGDKGLERCGKAVVDFGSHSLQLTVKEGSTHLDLARMGDRSDDLSELMAEVFKALAGHFDLDSVAAAGHRVVHGGDLFSGPAELNARTVEQITSLTDLAPLHQPQALRLVRAIKHLRPDLFQTASFDTTFHAAQPDLVRRFAIPRVYHERGIKRYGFHGLSYQSVSSTLASKSPEVAHGKIIVAHLGSGASLCAIDNGTSRDSSMGFSTLDGIPMATRPGWLDPGVLLHFLGPLGKTVGEVEEMLYHQSGLLGVSGGLSGDIRELFDNDGTVAKEAIDLFTLRIAGEIGRLASTLKGLDALVFTAGIGENQPRVRELVTERLVWLGVELDRRANDMNAFKISTAASRIAVYVIPTDEEMVIAEECLAVLNSRDLPPQS
ncbi:acetate kinase [Rhizobium sp. Root73]|uniref:acetate/propionate family kinase n=1 Tax=unclassified Rhizobium TaxID=2613769 RepID=UPI0007270DF4|nr:MULTISPECIES: acetate/propionate family kinase [unclassified Rhizobium]KQY12153.1 acetate kinase [Rhizobium sp. Root1334]KRC03976.1 acetate kinase [Rhizobium sp. Root73]